MQWWVSPSPKGRRLRRQCKAWRANDSAPDIEYSICLCRSLSKIYNAHVRSLAQRRFQPACFRAQYHAVSCLAASDRLQHRDHDELIDGTEEGIFYSRGAQLVSPDPGCAPRGCRLRTQVVPEPHARTWLIAGMQRSHVPSPWPLCGLRAP